MSDPEFANLNDAIADASRSIAQRDLRSRVIDASMAARAAFHALVCDNSLAALPSELAVVIAHDAFQAVWDEARQ